MARPSLLSARRRPDSAPIARGLVPAVLAATSLCSLGCSSSVPCVPLDTPAARVARLCALAEPAEHLSGNPNHPDHDRVLLGSLPESGGRPALRVEISRTYSVDLRSLTLDLERLAIAVGDRKSGHLVEDAVVPAPTRPEERARYLALLEEMRRVVRLVAEGGRDGLHDNRRHPELRPVLRFLDGRIAAAER